LIRILSHIYTIKMWWHNHPWARERFSSFSLTDKPCGFDSHRVHN